MKRSSFVLCVNNAGSQASLELRKVYRVAEDAEAAAEGLIRVVDDSGEDYLYPDYFFVAIDLPRAAEDVFVTKAG